MAGVSSARAHRITSQVAAGNASKANGNVARQTHHGIPDSTTTYGNDVPIQTDWSPNGTNVVLLRQLYQRGVMREELWDTNADGEFDLQIRYNAFSAPIATNVLGSKTPGN